MKIKIELPDEYWHALSVMAAKNGYETRQDFVAGGLISMVETDQDALARGREKMVLLRQAKDVVSDVPKVLAMVPIPVNFKAHANAGQEWWLEFRDGEIKRVKGLTPVDAFRIAVGRYPESQDEFNKLVKSCKLI